MKKCVLLLIAAALMSSAVEAKEKKVPKQLENGPAQLAQELSALADGFDDIVETSALQAQKALAIEKKLDELQVQAEANNKLARQAQRHLAGVHKHVAQLEQRADSLETHVAAVEKTAATLEKQKNELQQTAQGLQGQVYGLHHKVKQLKTAAIIPILGPLLFGPRD